MAEAVDFLMNLPRISTRPWRERRDYLACVAAVAASDGHLHEDEEALLNRWIEEFELPPKSRETVRAAARQVPEAELSRIEARMASTDLVYSLLLDMMGMAMADGILMDDEIQMLQRVAMHLGVPQVHFNILIEFVHAAHQASRLSSPEPLFEHSIMSAFELMRKQGVNLFEHTLLCVASPEYDDFLKARWAVFLAS